MRNRSLDILRTVAVVAVLLFHFTSWPLAQHGWMGVDLFFVLSGFLVSGLLFDELGRTGDVRGFRFLARRGFKIYPVFWIMIAATVATIGIPSGRALVCELSFFQNYGPGLWVHTWSLAVEEHFYFLIALAFALRRHLPNLANPRAKTRAFGLALLFVFVVRVVTVLVTPVRYKLVAFGTHDRVDSLLCGVFIAWLLREPTLAPRVRESVRSHRVLLVALAIGLLAPVCYLGHDHLFTKTIGYSFVYSAFGIVLLVALSMEPADPLSKGVAWIGRSSYSIYVWHVPLQKVALAWMVGRGLAWAGTPLVAIVASIGAGIVSTKLLEDPLLKLRDKLLRPPVAPTDAVRLRV